jgi:hypothetical protein
VRWVALLALLAGCDYVVGLTERIDAMPDVMADAAFDPADCPTTYKTVMGAAHRYRVHMVDGSYDESSIACLDDLLRTHLAVLDAPLEPTALRNFVETEAGAEDYFWLGARQDPTAGGVDVGWTWVTGGPIERTAWAMNEPNDGTDKLETHEEDFARFSIFESKLIDGPGDQMYYALCECDGVPAIP